MREVLPTLRQWNDDGRRFALATVVRTKGSSPRETGSVMGVREDGLVCGSVSGGCIESAVIEAALEAIGKGQPRKLEFPHVEGDKVWHTGLMCGGEVDVWIDPAPASRDPGLWSELATFVSSDTGCVLATRMDPFAQTLRRPGEAVCCSPLDAELESAYKSGQSRIAEVAGEQWFLNVLAPRPRLVIIGAVHIARALIVYAKQVGFETIVIDPRGAFADKARFDEQPDAMLDEWPQDALKGIKLDADTYAVALTHDPKIDEAALEVLLRSGVSYVGALGSKTTAAKRRVSLLERGLTEEQVARIHGPIGLDIGAENPEEIALAVIAEVVKVRRARG